jgi:hypothetical protein
VSVLDDARHAPFAGRSPRARIVHAIRARHIELHADAGEDPQVPPEAVVRLGQVGARAGTVGVCGVAAGQELHPTIVVAMRVHCPP